ncbi:MipA/OmpV family protein [Photobacterium alginatilyticum]|uniref:MipA/OmpV family protein n=1 Tax=Photobacterium alginatilyticum TaxID=1775171 RepID=UPI0040685A48
MKKNALLAMLALASTTTIAGEFSAGAITSYSPAVYLGADRNTVMFPMIGYEGEHVFLRGTTAGVGLLPLGTPLNVLFRVAYDPRALDPEDSDDIDIKKLDERKSGVLGGVTLQAINDLGTFEATVGSDIASNHNGIYAEALWKKPLNFGLYGFAPEFGYAFNSDKLNNHLYGVSQAEAERTRFNAFDGGWSGQLFVGVSAYTHLTRNVRVIGSVRYSRLDSALADSPIIENDDSVSGTLGIAYVF